MKPWTRSKVEFLAKQLHGDDAYVTGWHNHWEVWAKKGRQVGVEGPTFCIVHRGDTLPILGRRVEREIERRILAGVSQEPNYALCDEECVTKGCQGFKACRAQ